VDRLTNGDDDECQSLGLTSDNTTNSSSTHAQAISGAQANAGGEPIANAEHYRQRIAVYRS
jgi:hypothetical protein